MVEENYSNEYRTVLGFYDDCQWIGDAVYEAKKLGFVEIENARKYFPGGMLIVFKNPESINENKRNYNMNNKNTIRLTESDLKNMIKEAVEDVLDQDRRWYEYVQEEKRKHQALADFLKRNGIQSAELSQYQSGLPVVAMDTDEYYETNAGVLADNFLRGQKAYISSNTYPATTYLRINSI